MKTGAPDESMGKVAGPTQAWLVLVVVSLWCITLSALVADPSFFVGTGSLPFGLRTTLKTRHQPFAIAAIHPHDPTAFTEGFLFDNGKLYESTGRSGKSFVRVFKDFRNATVSQEYQLPPSYFGEGIAILEDRLYLLTYKAKRGFILDKHNLTYIDKFQFDTSTGEGWGMTTDGRHLIVSDGSARIYYWDPTTMAQVRTITVTDAKGRNVRNVNELEYIDGLVWFNVWFSTSIHACDGQTGKIVHTLDLGELVPQVDSLKTLNAHDKYNAVMNGLAYDPTSRHLLVTGKLWNKIFELKIAELLT